MYEAPVTIYETAVQTIMEEREGAIIAKIQSAFDVDVDKKELLRALQYDRNQYEKGYADGKAEAMAKIVMCKDCEYGIDEEHNGLYSCHASPWGMGGYNKADDFCSYGERREGE